MINITKLSVWPELQKLGFVPIIYRSYGKIYAVGASLQRELVDTNGNAFKSDIITIAPHHFQYSKKRYHITGNVKTPTYKEYYRLNGIGQKEKFYELETRINEFYAARDILPTVQLMLK